MRTPGPVLLSGTVVSLEPLSRTHVPDLLRAATVDPTAWRWMPVPAPRTADDVLALILAATADPTRIAWAVVVEGRAVGSTSFCDIDVSLGGVEIGWTWYSPAVWGTAVNPECKLLLLTHAFDDLDVERVLFKTDALNTRSRGALGRLGGQYDGTLRHSRRRPDGTVRDSAYFSILAAEWPLVRDGLTRRLA